MLLKEQPQLKLQERFIQSVVASLFTTGSTYCYYCLFVLYSCPCVYILNIHHSMFSPLSVNAYKTTFTVCPNFCFKTGTSTYKSLYISNLALTFFCLKNQWSQKYKSERQQPKRNLVLPQVIDKQKKKINQFVFFKEPTGSNWFKVSKQKIQ